MIPRSRLYAICGLLLVASAINYMDRQTLATAAKRITDEFQLSERQYGALEKSFGFAFAAGSLAFGVVADRVSVRLVYPTVLLLWSAAGFLTAYAKTYEHLLWCRGLLGFFEAGHWPCGLKATQLLLTPSQRPLGNGVLQSGTSIGAVIVPPLMLATMTSEPGSWRFGFQFVGAAGLFWIVAWFAVVRTGDLTTTPPSGGNSSPSAEWWSALLSRRMAVVVVVIALINTTWQTLRAWLPKIMQQQFEYTESFTAYFTSGWYVATDVGCLTSGAAALWFARRGWSVFGSRTLAFAVCALLCGALCFIPLLERGPLVLIVLLAAGAGALGLFPIYYSFSQDVSPRHQGKVAGVTGVAAWIVSGQTSELFGWLADASKSFRPGLAVAGLLPALALATIVFLWPKQDRVLLATR
jgi:MFS transporter, ACS family, hexuronate transporter